jgi:DNA polymerase V
VPEGAAPDVLAFLDDYRIRRQLVPVRVATLPRSRRVPYFVAKVPAGFPSPAELYLEEALDFNEHLIPPGHAAATYVIRVSGWSMIGAGIHDGDELVVDRAEENALGKVVVAVHNGAMTIKRLHKRAGKLVLMAENPHYPDRVIAEGDEFSIWGVVVRVLHTP